MVAGLTALGCSIDTTGTDDFRIAPAEPVAAPQGIDCGLAGTVMRFLPPMAAVAAGTSRFTGDDAASRRPLIPLLDGLSQLGVQVQSQTGSVPFTMTAPQRLGGPVVRIDSSASSQFISGLLLSAARFPDGLDLTHLGESVPSAPHIAMTVDMLRQRGVQVDCPSDHRWRVQPSPIDARDCQIEPDLTNAAAFLVAGVLSGGQTTIAAWPLDSIQPGAMIIDVLQAFGAAVGHDENGLTAKYLGRLRGQHIDLHRASELTPVVAALAAASEGVTTIVGVAHIRGHETDRLAAICTELNKFGVPTTELPDGLRIEGRGDALGELTGGLFGCYADHRLAQLGALLGLRIPGIVLDDEGAFAKTMPDFTQRWSAMIRQGGLP